MDNCRPLTANEVAALDTSKTWMRVTVEFGPMLTNGRNHIGHDEMVKIIKDEIDKHPEHALSGVLKQILIGIEGRDNKEEPIPTKITSHYDGCGSCYNRDGRGYIYRSEIGGIYCMNC